MGAYKQKKTRTWQTDCPRQKPSGPIEIDRPSRSAPRALSTSPIPQQMAEEWCAETELCTPFFNTHGQNARCCVQHTGNGGGACNFLKMGTNGPCPSWRRGTLSWGPWSAWRCKKQFLDRGAPGGALEERTRSYAGGCSSPCGCDAPADTRASESRTRTHSYDYTFAGAAWQGNGCGIDETRVEIEHCPALPGCTCSDQSRREPKVESRPSGCRRRNRRDCGSAVFDECFGVGPCICSCLKHAGSCVVSTLEKY